MVIQTESREFVNGKHTSITFLNTHLTKSATASNAFIFGGFAGIMQPSDRSRKI